jgi:hypothetical protein
MTGGQPGPVPPSASAGFFGAKSGAAGSAAVGVAPALGGVPPPFVGPTLPDELLAQPVTFGLQVKPAPQSALALHGSCHLNAHADTVLVTQSMGAGLGTGSQAVLGGQGAIDAPPEHCV